MSTFKVKVNALGHGTVMLDGRDISLAVRGLTLKTWAGDLTTLQVNLFAKDMEFVGDSDEVRFSIEDKNGKVHHMMFVEVSDGEEEGKRDEAAGVQAG